MVCRLPTCCGICFSSRVGSFIRAPYRILPSEFNAHLFPRGGYQPADCDQDCVARSKWLDICSFTIDCVLIPHFTPFYVAPRTTSPANQAAINLSCRLTLSFVLISGSRLESVRVLERAAVLFCRGASDD